MSHWGFRTRKNIGDYLREIRERAEQVDKNTYEVVLAIAVEILLVTHLSPMRR